ncbi:MAG: hypothetical protein ACRD1U_12560 [Vicinamibacterales bacterium]
MARLWLRPAVVAFVMACVPRVWAWWYFPSPEPNNQYWLSESLLTTGALAFGDDPASFVEPIYPAFLAILRATAGSERLALLIQALVAATGGAAICRLTARISGSSTAGLCAAAFYAFDPYFVRQSTSYIAVPLQLPLVLWALDRLVAARRAASAAVAGGLFGLVFLLRASLLPVCLGALALLAVRRLWRQALVAAVVMVAIVLPWSIRSHRAGNGVFPTTLGQYLYLSTSIHAVGVVPIYDIGLLMRFAHFRLDEALGEPRSVHSEGLADRILARRALEFAVTHPVETVALKLQNLLWIPAPILLPRNATSEYTHAAMIDGRMQLTGVERRPWTWEVLHTSFRSIVLFAAIAGLRRRREFDDAILLIVLISETIVHTVLFPTTRLLVVFEAVVMVYAGIGARGFRTRHVNSQPSNSLGASFEVARDRSTPNLQLPTPKARGSKELGESRTRQL